MIGDSPFSRLFVGLEVTRRCTSRCPHCYTASSPTASQPDPPGETLGALCEALARAGVRKAAFSGGEPLLRADLEPVMRRGMAAGLRGFGLVTNGHLLDRARAQSLRRAGLGSAQVSIDGADAADHVAVRGGSPADYYQALRAVRLLREAGVMVQIAALVTPRNIVRFDELLRLAEALGVDSLRFCSFVPAGRAAAPAVRRRLQASPEQLDLFITRFRAAARDEGYPCRLLLDHGIGPWAEDGRFTCVAGERVAYVTGDGRLYPCPGLLFPPFAQGWLFRSAAPGEPPTVAADLVEQLGALSTSPARRLPRADLAAPCGTCPSTSCSGGCRGAAFAATGEVTGAPSYCAVARARHAEPAS
ncbi:MAG: radical SAM protein [Myxococcota bacterium]|jgi:radical SAM protein with 4Fe4S-binding SPASM domain|nr:radical SAM protein [Myxococcota bacterium]